MPREKFNAIVNAVFYSNVLKRETKVKHEVRATERDGERGRQLDGTTTINLRSTVIPEQIEPN